MIRNIVIAIAGFYLITGCSSRIVFPVNDLQVKQTVNMQLRSGESITGDLEQIDDTIIVITEENGNNRRVNKRDILQVTGTEPVYDIQDNIISESEIEREKNNSRTWLYTIGGGGLSMGASFFLGSMVSRIGDGDIEDGMIWGITGVGTAIGTYLFANKGAEKDRLLAIDRINGKRTNGYEGEIESEQERRNLIREEITRLRKEREEQEAELEALQKELLQKNQEQAEK